MRNMADAKAIQKEVAHQRTVRSTPTHDHSPLGNLTLLAAFQAAALRASRDDLSKLDGEEVTTKTFEARLIAALVYETASRECDVRTRYCAFTRHPRHNGLFERPSLHFPKKK